MARLSSARRSGLFNAATAVHAVFSLAALGVIACGASDPEPLTPRPTPSVAASAPPSASASVVAAPPEPTIDDHRAAAHSAIAAHDSARAKIEVSAILAASPADVDALTMLGDVLTTQGDAAGAADALFTASVADGGRDEMLTLRAADALYRQARYDDERVVAIAGLGAHEASLPIRLHIALAETALVRWQDAAASYKVLTERFPDEPVLWARRGALEAQVGLGTDAHASAKMARTRWAATHAKKDASDTVLGKGVDAVAEVVRGLRQAGDLELAQKVIAEVRAAGDDKHPELEVERALVDVRRHDARHARETIERLRKIVSDDYAPIHIAIAAVELESKHADIARKEIDLYRSKSGADPDYVIDAHLLAVKVSAATSR